MLKSSMVVGVVAAAGLSSQASAHCGGHEGCPGPLAGVSNSVALPNALPALPAAGTQTQSAVGSPTPGVFDIRFNFLSTVTTAQQQAFEASAAFWESVIVGYQPGVTLDGIEIDITLENIDGAGGVLGFGGITGFLFDQGGFTFVTDSTRATQSGAITLDTSDFGAVPNASVINHEVAHTLGFGLLFDDNGLAVDGSGQFTGANGLAAFQDEFDPDATFVPIELDGGPGTANGHLDEGAGLTDIFGRGIENELLTGFLGPNIDQTFLSNTTVAIFEDLGFEVVLPNVIPEPSTAALLLGLGGLLARRRRADA